ncbi:bifunctional nuclease family protein [Kiritimatiella glycovorans]|uniref:BFN domain-containing protein n=1 Tax=Kiritimatiella glycovorans TaxID=1307763 RepID=A0A0G3EEE5_9BACT|nr:bifunctional nuclease family protein [Kiritimatiella glycovorans]AKJ63797.1 hypothetical protein L21SP4_00525 [Kiritimatiella glycovorans]
MSDELQVQIKGLMPTPSGCGVFLGNGKHGGKIIAIFVDHHVAAAITMFLKGVEKPRPLTHDLITHIFAGLDARLEKVLINDLKNDTYYARLYITQENELGRNVVEIDARPSDSMALALQQHAPIFVKASVWERAEDMAWALEESSGDEDGDEDVEE